MRKLQRIFILCLLSVFGVLFMTLGSAQALTLDGPRDCDANAVIRCGAMTPAELAQKTHNNDSIADIYSYFGISSADVANMDQTAVAGTVTNTGLVRVDGKTVATDAVTAGRQNISGSTQVTRGGTTFFVRPTNVSFVSASLSAFVVMQDGKFSFAILASCGNPVKATPLKPVAKPAAAPTVKPTPTAPTPKAQPSMVNVVNSNTNINNNTVTQSQSQAQASAGGTAPASASAAAQTPSSSAQSEAQTTAAATPAPPAAAAASTPSTLPNTGSGAAIAISSLATIGGTIGHMFYRRFKQHYLGM
jgi:hypothetical protein